MDEQQISASQEEIWLECKRKWSFQYVDRLPRVQHESAALGTETHRQLQEWYDHGTPLLYSSGIDQQETAARVAGVMLEHLPTPRPDLKTEYEFHFYTDRHHYMGKIDLLDHSTLTVFDHKTTSNFKWKKTPEDLRYDVQAQLYAKVMLTEWKTSVINLQWTYGRTKGKAIAEPVSLLLDADHVGATFAIIEQTADEITAARLEGKRSLDMAPTPESCEKYGGCPYRHICNLGPKDRMHAFMSTASTTDALLTRLRGQQGAAATTVAPGQINPPESVLAQTPAEAEAALPVKEPGPAQKPKAAKKTKEPKADAKPIGTLYMNAMPIGGAIVPFESVVAEAQKIIAATDWHDQKGEVYHVADYRYIQYGQGAPAFVAAVQQALGAFGRVEELVVTDTATPEASICVNTLVVMADRTVRGTR